MTLKQIGCAAPAPLPPEGASPITVEEFRPGSVRKRNASIHRPMLRIHTAEPCFCLIAAVALKDPPCTSGVAFQIEDRGGWEPVRVKLAFGTKQRLVRVEVSQPL